MNIQLKKDFELDAGAEIIPPLGGQGLWPEEAGLARHLTVPRRIKPASSASLLTGDSPPVYFKLSEEPPGDWAGFGENGPASTMGEWTLGRNKRQVAMMMIKRRSTHSERPLVRQNAVREGSKGRPKLVRQNAVDHHS